MKKALTLILLFSRGGSIPLAEERARQDAPATSAPGTIESAPPAALQETAGLPCPTCEGEARVELECEDCHGAGKGPCYECKDPCELPDGYLETLKLTSPDEAARLERALQGTRQVTKELRGLFHWGEPGWLRCPASCLNGRSLPSLLKCLLCKGKGRVRCPTCSGKGTGKCRTCGGRRRFAQTCPECVGLGRIEDPRTRTSKDMRTCPWCRGEPLRECLAGAAHEKGGELSCVWCAGTGSRLCRFCASTHRAPCSACRATGLTRGDFVPSEACTRCEGSGIRDCAQCSKGRVPCPPCAGTGWAPKGCSACMGGKALCQGCRNASGRSWRIIGERLLASGDRELGIGHLEIALLREEHAARIRLEDEDLAPQQRKELQRQLDRELTAWRRRLAKAREDS